jgi:pyrroloquinoline quinone biosynthesis protein E
VGPPDALLAELTYRCPLRCGYCSNPVDLLRHREEIDTDTWCRVFSEAAELGVLHLHLSGGEPLARPDLARLVTHARTAGLYTNLITSAYGLDDARLDALETAGIDHIQISIQHVDPTLANAIAGTDVHDDKLRAARAVHARGIPLSINVVIHRGNIDRVGEIIALASDLGAERLELATAQYHGWALKNRDALLPSREALERAADAVRAARSKLGSRLAILYVLPDYYTDVPKPCMDGWGRRFMTVTPDGIALPCPGAHALPLAFETVRDRALRAIWFESEAFNAYRGAAWMKEPCVSCERRDVDFGGCRCQAFALTGDARNADPACAKAPAHGLVTEARESAHREAPEVLYRVRSSRAH